MLCLNYSRLLLLLLHVLPVLSLSSVIDLFVIDSPWYSPDHNFTQSVVNIVNNHAHCSVFDFKRSNEVKLKAILMSLAVNEVPQLENATDYLYFGCNLCNNGGDEFECTMYAGIRKFFFKECILTHQAMNIKTNVKYDVGVTYIGADYAVDPSSFFPHPPPFFCW